MTCRVVPSRWAAALTVAAIAVALPSSSVRGALQNAQSFSPVDNAYTNQISGTDLINTGQASLGTVAYSNSNPAGASQGYPLSHLNDGQSGSNGTLLVSGSDFDETATFSLNLDPLTGGNAAGYNVTGVNVFAGATSGAGRANQKFQLLVSTLASAGSFTDLGTYSYVTATGGTDATAPASTLQSLTSASGTIATGVSAIRFVFQDPGAGSSGTLYQEVDVLGTVATPEPTSLTLLALGSSLLAARRRHR